jgi:hypothetical protein
MRARYYAPAIMRFINADVLTGSISDPGTLNRYAYANGNPVSYIDPFGRSAELTENLHTAFDGLGMIPGAGMVFDGINAIWYTAEGDWVNAGLAAGSLIPIGGDILGGGKLIKKLVGKLPRIGKAADTVIRGSDIVFGSDSKSLQKLSRQMKERGWTEQSVRDLVDNHYTTRKSTNVTNNNPPATVFYREDGHHVIVDDITGEVVQVSDRTDPKWIPDKNIIDPYKP